MDVSRYLTPKKGRYQDETVWKWRRFLCWGAPFGVRLTVGRTGGSELCSVKACRAPGHIPLLRGVGVVGCALWMAQPLDGQVRDRPGVPLPIMGASS